MSDGTQEKQKVCIWTKYLKCKYETCPLECHRFCWDLDYYLTHTKGLKSCGLDEPHHTSNDKHMEIAVALKPLDEFPSDFYLYERLYGFLNTGKIVMNSWFCSALKECHTRWEARCG